MTWLEQFYVALAADPAGPGACHGCTIEVLERAKRGLRMLCVVCWVRESIEVPQKPRPLKRHHAAHGPKPGKGLPADIPALRGKK